MVIWECLDLWSQRNKPWFVPDKMLHETTTSIPDATFCPIDRCEDVKQMLDIRIL